MIQAAHLKAHLEEQLRRLAQRGFDVRPLVFDPPASEAQVQDFEQMLGHRLPASFRQVLRDVSAHVEFRWFAPRELSFPEPFLSNFSGDLHWSLELVPRFEVGRKGWVERVFSDASDPYDAVWHDKLAIQEVGNGDLIAIDLHPARYEQVVYLSHDDGEGHGCVLAENFESLLERWIPLGCPGGEDWQWLPFVQSSTSFIDAEGERARTWVRLLFREDT